MRTTPVDQPSFNGAGMFLSRKYEHLNRDREKAAKLQWGRDVSIPEIPHYGRLRQRTLCFNGAGMFLSRKLDKAGFPEPRFRASIVPGCFYPENGAATAPAVPMRGFNGAGMFLSRKCGFLVTSNHDRLASMGPGCFYPGNTASTVITGTVAGFNGAGMFLSRK